MRATISTPSRHGRVFRRGVLLLSLVASLALLARDRGIRVRLPVPRAHPTLDTVVLIVLDTVRADHTSMCGYSRPTTPNLAALAARSDTLSTCDAIAPGAWTVPSHATFFTGLPPWQHRADFAPETEGVGWPRVRPLAPDVPTVAEQLAQQGYQTVMVAANGTLGLPLGLTRGFNLTRIARRQGGDTAWTVQNLDDVLAERQVYKADGLFLMVNVFDAHGPRPAIGPEVTWLPQGDTLSVVDDVALAYLGDRLPEGDAERWKGHLINSYDNSVRHADDTLGQVLALINERGWLEGHPRVIVTSDHGEMLGEEHAFGHGSWVNEANARVPLVTLGLPSCAPPSHWVSLINVYSMLLDGSCQDVTSLATSTALPDADRAQLSHGLHGTQTRIGVWSRSTMVESRDREVHVWKPGSTDTPTDLPPPAASLQQTTMVADALDLPPQQVEVSQADLDEVYEGLKALGYVQ